LCGSAHGGRDTADCDIGDRDLRRMWVPWGAYPKLAPSTHQWHPGAQWVNKLDLEWRGAAELLAHVAKLTF